VPLPVDTVVLLPLAALLVATALLLALLPVDTAVEAEEAVMVTIPVEVGMPNKDSSTAVSNTNNNNRVEVDMDEVTTTIPLVTPVVIVMVARAVAARKTPMERKRLLMEKRTLMDPLDVNNNNTINPVVMVRKNDRAAMNLLAMDSRLAATDRETTILMEDLELEPQPQPQLVDTVEVAATTMITNMALAVVNKNLPMASPKLPMVKLNLLTVKKKRVEVTVVNNNTRANTTKRKSLAPEVDTAVVAVVVAVVTMRPLDLKG